MYNHYHIVSELKNTEDKGNGDTQNTEGMFSN